MYALGLIFGILRHVIVEERIHFDHDAFAIQLVLQQCCVKVFRRPFYYSLKGWVLPMKAFLLSQS